MLSNSTRAYNPPPLATSSTLSPLLTSTVVNNTSIVTVDGVKMHLLDNMLGILTEERIADDKRLQELLVDPFWGYLWPGSYALHRYCLKYPDLTVRGRNVLDFASGCGLSAITAAKFDPAEVRLHEERSNELTTSSQMAKAARARTSIQDAPPP